MGIFACGFGLAEQPGRVKPGASEWVNNCTWLDTGPPSPYRARMGLLSCGAGLSILERHLKDGSVDLVYLEGAAIGVLILFSEPGAGMCADTASAGFYTHKLTGQLYPKLQLRTVEELLEGKGLAHPSNYAAVDQTFKRAPKARGKGGVPRNMVH